MSALLVSPDAGRLIDLSSLVPGPVEVMEPEQAPDQPLLPPVPETIDDTGLSSSTIEQLAFKFLYFRGDVLGRDLATAMGFKFSLIDSLMEGMKRQLLVQVKRSLGIGNSSSVFAL